MRSVFGDRDRLRQGADQAAALASAPAGADHDGADRASPLFPPGSPFYCDDFAAAGLELQGLFIHEMAHVWQAQRLGKYYLPLFRHPFCRYAYRLRPGWPLTRYGIEQQAEIVRHAFLLRRGARPEGAGEPAAYDRLLDFPGAGQPIGIGPA